MLTRRIAVMPADIIESETGYDLIIDLPGTVLLPIQLRKTKTIQLRFLSTYTRSTKGFCFYSY